MAGIRIVEFAGLGPGPFACMLLADLGADVVRIDRPGSPAPDPGDIVSRGRRRVVLDLKEPQAVDEALALLDQAHGMVEGFRPGVMERLGLGPDEALARNPRLVYGRITGWGQTGPWAQVAGHDINYIALVGALDLVGAPGGPPVPPLNLVGDYAGGSLYLVMGMLAALVHARATGQGQVVDASICDGVLSLLSNNQSHRLRGMFRNGRGSNMLDGGAPYYATYETADGRYMSVGAIEPQFFEQLCRALELSPSLWDAQHDRARWPELRIAIAQAFRQHTMAHWCGRLDGTDCCVAPVLTLEEARDHPHIKARAGFWEAGGVLQSAPAPRLSRTPAKIAPASSAGPMAVRDVLAGWQADTSQSTHQKDEAS